MSGGLRPQGHLEPELGTGQCPGGSEPCRCCLSLAAQLRLARPSGGSGFWGRSVPLGLPQPALCLSLPLGKTELEAPRQLGV